MKFKESKERDYYLHKMQKSASFFAHKKESEERTLKKIYNTSSFDKNLYLNGEKWFNDGHSIEDASQEFRENSSFTSGYERAKRLKYIDELKKEKDLLITNEDSKKSR